MSRTNEPNERWKWPPSASGLLQLDYEVPQLGDEPPILPPSCGPLVAGAIQPLAAGSPDAAPNQYHPRNEDEPDKLVAICVAAVLGLLGLTCFVLVIISTAKDGEHEQVESVAKARQQMAERRRSESERQRRDDASAVEIYLAARAATRRAAIATAFDDFGQIPRIGLTKIKRGMVFRLVPSIRVSEVVDGGRFLAASAFDTGYGWEQYLIENVNTENLADGMTLEDDDIRCEGRSLHDLTFYCSGNTNFRGRTVIRVERLDAELADGEIERFVSKRPGANPLDLDHSP